MSRPGCYSAPAPHHSTHPWLEAELCDPELPVLTRSMLPPLWPESLLLVLDSLFLLSLSLASCNDGDKTGE